MWHKFVFFTVYLTEFGWDYKGKLVGNIVLHCKYKSNLTLQSMDRSSSKMVSLKAVLSENEEGLGSKEVEDWGGDGRPEQHGENNITVISFYI